MELDKIRIVDINPAVYNPRNISDSSIEKLKRSISEFGFVDPIIINLKNNRIIGGHQRYQILMENYKDNTELNLFKIGDIGWVFPNDELRIEDEEHEKALNLNLNQTNLMGEWDNEKLKDLFNDLNDVDFDLELTGFDDFEIDLFLDDDYEVFEYQHVINETEEEEEQEEDSDNKHTDEEETEEKIVKAEQVQSSDIYGEELVDDVESHVKADEIRVQEKDNINKKETESLNDKSIKKSIDVADIIPDDYVDVKGDNANKSYVLSIGFDTQEIANKFLKYMGYHRKMKRDTLQFMWSELNWDLDKLLYEKDQKRISKEEQELCLSEEINNIWDYQI